MAYTADAQIFRAQVDRAIQRVGGRAAVWAGIGAYRLTVAGTVERIRWARDAGASGIVVFSHESFVTGDLDRLREGAFAPPASSPARPRAGSR
jgi:dihydrodipicolinate synthase/N-acetylneuraminate lyase